MKKICQIKGNLSLFLIGAILVLCAGFVIIGCGAGSNPQQKAEESDKGAYAVDFNACPDDFCYATLTGSDQYPIPSIEGEEFSIEAWVKRRAASATDLDGAIFSRLDAANGTALYIVNSEPKFAIRVATGASTTTPGSTGSVDYKVGSGFTLVQDAWTHIIGIITNTAHSDHPTSTSCTTTVMAETPHLDIYVDGEFKNCATTWGGSGDPATGPQFADNPGSYTVNIGQMGATLIDGETTITTSDNLEAAIDELRIWMSARTTADIAACINSELGLSGTCNRLDSSLVAYFRFNEGHEEKITDFSGSGLSSGLVTRVGTPELPFTTGWVSGNPSLQRAD